MICIKLLFNRWLKNIYNIVCPLNIKSWLDKKTLSYKHSFLLILSLGIQDGKIVKFTVIARRIKHNPTHNTSFLKNIMLIVLIKNGNCIIVKKINKYINLSG